jgi:hypothetical protein
MAGARQSTGQEAMISILRKLETMVDMTNQTYEQTLLVLSSTEAIMKNEVSVELKKQTGILMSIEAKLNKTLDQQTSGKEFDDKEIATMSKSLGELVKAAKKVNDKLGDNVKSFLMKLSEGFKSFTESADAESVTAFADAISKISRGVLIYALAMAVATPLLIIAMPGAILFGLTIRLLLASSGIVDKDKVEGISAVLGLARGVLLFGLAMVVYTVLAPVAIIGATLFGLTIRLLLAASGLASKDKAESIGAVLNLAKGILLFTLAMVLVTAFFPIVLIGAGMFALSMLIISLGLNMIGSKDARRGVITLIGLSLSIIFFGLTILAFTNSVDPMDAVFVALSVATFGLIFYVMGKGFTDILKGAFSVVAISLSIAILGLSLLLYTQANISWEQIAQLGVIIVGLGIAMALAGAVAGNIILGSAAMIVASAAIIVLSVGLLIYSQANITLEDAAILGLIVVGLGTAMGIAGVASPFIIAGSAAMILAGVALLPIALGLSVFKAIGFTKDDGQNLTMALGSVISGFLGGEMPGGLLASLKFAAQAAARSALLLVAIPPMILAGAALMLIVPALSIFKKAGFNKSDADNIEYMIGSVVKAFGIVTDTDRQKEMGFNVNPIDLFLGIQSLAGAGRVLAGLADGVKAWANLEVNEWEVINPGTKDAKLVIKGRRKLTKADFDNAAYGIAQVINATSEPFAKVGRLEKGQPSGDPIYDAIFGGGFVSAGVDSLARSGDTLVNLAKGIQSWANLEITEYEVIGAGTKNAKIVPKSIRKMSSTDFSLASANIGMVIGFLAKEFAKIGEMEKNTSGIFADGVVKLGIESIANLGDNLLSIAEVITKMANMEIVENEVRMIDGKPQLVPKSVRKITPTEMAKAAINIGTITGFLAKEIAKIGQMEANSEGWFADGYVKKGQEAIAGLGQNLSAMADTIIKMANTEITEYRVNEKGELVPVSTRKMGEGDFAKASDNIAKILGIVVDKMAEVGRKVSENEDVIEKATEALPNMTQVLADAAKPIEAWSKLKDTDKIGASMVNFYDTIKAVFDPDKNATISDTDRYFTSFAANIEKIAAPENTLDKVATNVDRIEKSMKLLKETINSMDLKKLTLTDSLMKSIAMLSRNPEAIAKAIEGSIEKSFEELIDALKEIVDQAQASANASAAAVAAPAPVAGSPAAPAAKAPAAPQPDIADALKKALNSVTMKVVVSNQNPIPTTGG